MYLVPVRGRRVPSKLDGDLTNRSGSVRREDQSPGLQDPSFLVAFWYFWKSVLAGFWVVRSSFWSNKTFTSIEKSVNTFISSREAVNRTICLPQLTNSCQNSDPDWFGQFSIRFQIWANFITNSNFDKKLILYRWNFCKFVFFMQTKRFYQWW